MMRAIVLRVLICVFMVSFSLYLYVDKQNEVMRLRIKLPELASDIRTIQEENIRLQYDIEQFENPNHLMQLARQSEFRHLKHPLENDILVLQENKVVTDDTAQIPQTVPKTIASFTLGAKQ